MPESLVDHIENFWTTSTLEKEVAEKQKCCTCGRNVMQVHITPHEGLRISFTFSALFTNNSYCIDELGHKKALETDLAPEVLLFSIKYLP